LPIVRRMLTHTSPSPISAGIQCKTCRYPFLAGRRLAELSLTVSIFKAASGSNLTCFCENAELCEPDVARFGVALDEFLFHQLHHLFF
jgi:hypothetical protein